MQRHLLPVRLFGERGTLLIRPRFSLCEWAHLISHCLRNRSITLTPITIPSFTLRTATPFASQIYPMTLRISPWLWIGCRNSDAFFVRRSNMYTDKNGPEFGELHLYRSGFSCGITRSKAQVARLLQRRGRQRPAAIAWRGREQQRQSAPQSASLPHRSFSWRCG